MSNQTHYDLENEQILLDDMLNSNETIREKEVIWENELDENIEEAEVQESSQFRKIFSFPEKLKVWATSYRINHMALKHLLKILNSHVLSNNLPSDPRTF